MSESSNSRPYHHHNPVTVSDSVGALFLGILNVILVVALLRSQARNRELLRQANPLTKQT